jgi:hypothetical protein
MLSSLSISSSPFLPLCQAKRRAHEGPSATLALAWTFALPNTLSSPQPPPPSLSSRSRRHQISPSLNVCIAELARRMRSLPWRRRSVKRQRWCSDIDNGGGDWQGGGTAAFVVVRQQSAGRGLAALVVVSVMSRWQRQYCWHWVWRAEIGTRGFGHTYHCAKNSALGSTFFAPGSAFLLPGAFFIVRPLL